MLFYVKWLGPADKGVRGLATANGRNQMYYEIREREGALKPKGIYFDDSFVCGIDHEGRAMISASLLVEELNFVLGVVVNALASPE